MRVPSGEIAVTPYTAVGCSVIVVPRLLPLAPHLDWLLAKQDGVLTLAQAREAGYTRGSLQHLLCLGWPDGLACQVGPAGGSSSPRSCEIGPSDRCTSARARAGMPPESRSSTEALRTTSGYQLG